MAERLLQYLPQGTACDGGEGEGEGEGEAMEEETGLGGKEAVGEDSLLKCLAVFGTDVQTSCVQLW